MLAGMVVVPDLATGGGGLLCGLGEEFNGLLRVAEPARHHKVAVAVGEIEFNGSRDLVFADLILEVRNRAGDGGADLLKDIVGVNVVDDFTTLENNKLSEEKVKEAADMRCESWCRQFGLRNTIDSAISDELTQTFVQTRQVLTDMIQFCLDNQLKPLLVVTPVSAIMNERISDAFMEKVLFSNIKKANVQNIPVLNYLRDNEFEDYRLYHNNADCLNARGRCLFTKKLLTDTKSVFKNDKNEQY